MNDQLLVGAIVVSFGVVTTPPSAAQRRPLPGHADLERKG